MTNEEAIKIFKEVREEVIAKETELSRQVFENLGIKAIDLAIKALEQQSSEDCINRKATIDAIYKKHIGGKDAIENAPINDLYACGLEEAVDAVENMPSVTPQPKTGYWIDGFGGCKCSECGCLEAGHSDYCPNCGAKMKEVEE